MQRKKRRIIPLIIILLLIGARIYFSYQEKERIEKQQELIDEISRRQLEERNKAADSLQYINDWLIEDLNKQKSRLGSIGRELKKSHENFKKQLGKE